MTAPAFTGTFTMVDPEHVAQVGPAAALLFARICWRAEQSRGAWAATRRTLMTETGLSEAMLRTATKVLRDREWVTACRASEEDATLVWSPILPGQGHVAESAPPLVESAPPPCGITTTPPAESAISSYETGKTYPLPPAGGGDGGLFPDPLAPAPAAASDPLSGFDDWYAEYPRKTAKGDARKAWSQVLRAGADPAVILAGLRRQAVALADQHVRGFCPYPATWLRSERWADEDHATVTPIRPGAPQAYDAYDADYEATLPPPRTDPFAAGGL